jgi:hypothetical protein
MNIKLSKACYEECQSQSVVLKSMLVWRGGSIPRQYTVFKARTENGNYPKEMSFENFSK